MHVVFLIAALVSIAAVALICVFLFVNGIPAIKEIGFGDFTLGEVWKPTNGYYGILPFILGSIYVTAGALIIGVPIGLLTAIYLAKFCPDRLYKVIKPFINLMAGIPSVVYGFFGMCVLVPMVRSIFGVNGNTMLTASVLLGVRTLTTNIVMEMGYATDLHRQALIATGVVLFVFILIINLLFSIIKRKTVA